MNNQKKLVQKYFYKYHKKTQDQILEEQIEEKVRIMSKIELSDIQIAEINESIDQQADELQRVKFWLYVANNELEKDKLKYKLTIHGLKKRNRKMVDQCIQYQHGAENLILE